MSPGLRTAGAARGRVLEVEGGRPLRGRVSVPGDKSVSHRALLLGALATGPSRLRGLSDGEDVARTAEALRRMGAVVDDGRVGPGPGGLRPPDGPLDMGNSGTSLRLLAGVVAARPWRTELVGDDSLSGRPMDRVAVPLRAMGAEVEGRGARCLPPVRVRGGALHGIDYTPPMASAQVKSCVLLAGLGAEGETVVREPVATRVHTEELLARCGADLAVGEEGGCYVVRLRPSALAPFTLHVPGDPSQAAFWLVAACVVPGSAVTVAGIYTGPGRRGFLDVLRRMGADLAEEPVTGPDDLAATADVTARAGELHGTTVDGDEITGLDEVPVLAVAAACAAGTTEFRRVGELRVKESDRLAGVVGLVRAFGARAEAEGDTLVVHGAGALRAGALHAGGDHRMAMAGAVAGLAAPGTTRVAGWEAVATSYPRFTEHLAALTAGGPG
ncbi:MAG TPA: 3-phosphoshikimate 1-carboxyvinyltransferase [Acidimicrobiales bacterium]|nr:3-phosphoshikimate 1-carboxyvinyltransferase [Acidimicrobiales bacterium]